MIDQGPGSAKLEVLCDVFDEMSGKSDTGRRYLRIYNLDC